MVTRLDQHPGLTPAAVGGGPAHVLHSEGACCILPWSHHTGSVWFPFRTRLEILSCI